MVKPSSVLSRKEKQPLPIDFEIGGVYLPPIAQALLLAIPIFMVLDWALRRLGVLRLVWHEALFEGALYACVCATLILLMGA
ncbi:Protein AaeX [Pseudomonas fluorescens]|uniref:Protein AaeX n=1 Tax=Pseudomonas fluorescens TaxID=294 RepID=A0A5E6XU17_PSEFL|nr:Protein AaeX [Pseudomonas fluorescens]